MGKNKNEFNKGEIIIYKTSKNGVDLKINFKKESVWLRQTQIAKLFRKERSVVTKHINKILKDKEVDKKSNVQKMHIANSDKPVMFYGLDIVLAVGYKTNSKEAIRFRKWSTSVLRKYLLQGYAVNKERLSYNKSKLLEAIQSIKKLSKGNDLVGSSEALNLVEAFASTWVSLDAYDKSNLPKKGASKKKIKFTSDELEKAVQDLKMGLIKKKEASNLFALEKNSGNFAGIVGNIFQTFGGKDLYPTIEEKAAHLLYFVVKNHVFNDGNKRTGAFCFVWFLQKAGLLDENNLTPSALTALTLLIAESKPKDKDRMIGLILILLKR